jgi:NAD(P)-dependent dehydrogenase (short-subunit alcohol dehydrogenase family)
MKIAGSKVLVTGANRGLGKALVQGLRDAGAAKTYAGARNAQTITPAAGVEPVALDITKPEQVAAAARSTRRSRST